MKKRPIIVRIFIILLVVFMLAAIVYSSLYTLFI